MRSRSTSICIRRIAGSALLFVLLGAGNAPLQAQDLPSAEIFQSLGPDESDTGPIPTPNGEEPNDVGLGTAIARHGDTALIAEGLYPDTAAQIGRVAVFTRNSAGQWVRTGAIDSPTGQRGDRFGGHLALFKDVALISSEQGMYVFNRLTDGTWKQVQLLRLKTPWQFTDVALNGHYAFLATELNTQGVVYAYSITAKGRLSFLHALNSGVDFDSFAQHLALSRDHVVVSATTDANRGAAYVFERRGNRWRKQQKLVAIDGATNDSFSGAVAISGDMIAIGAPGVDGAPSPRCPAPTLGGAIYVFRQINGTWLEQQVLPAANVAATPPHYGCLTSFGRNVAVSGRWLVGTADSQFPLQFAAPVIYRKDAGQFTPVALTGFTDEGQPMLNLKGQSLFVGLPFNHGCNSAPCFGGVDIYQLNKAIAAQP